jgi:hypothetical protein
MSDPLDMHWDDAAIAKELAARSEPLEITVAAAMDVIHLVQDDHAAELAEQQAQNEALQNQVAALEKQLADAQQPADVTITIDTSQSRTNHLQQGVAIVTNEFLPASKAAAVAKMSPYAHDLYAMSSYHLSTGFGVMDAWYWDGTGTRPAKPTNLASLKAMANLANQFGRPHLLTVYAPSWHMKRQRGRKLTYSEMWGSHETGRLAGESKADWTMMVEELFVASATEILKVDPDATIYAQVHNEFKGMWELLDKDVVLKNQNWADGNNPGTPGYGDIDYGPYYDLSITGIQAGMARLGLAEANVRFGGPYAVMQSEYVRDADAVPVGHPLANCIWGNSGKQAPNAIERFIAYCKTNSLPLDFLVVDGGTRNKDLRYETDAFGQLTKVSDCTLHVRSLLDAAGYLDTPIWWAERYLTERPYPGTDSTKTEQARLTPYQDSMPRRSVVTVAGLGEMAWAGVGMAFQWGLRGEDGDPVINRENAAYFRADGSPTDLYHACALFQHALPAGCTLYPLKVDGDDFDALPPGVEPSDENTMRQTSKAIGGWASDTSILIYNKTDQALTVRYANTSFELAGNGLLEVDR